MYRYAKVEVGAASDSSLNAPVFGPLKAFIEQTLDRKSFSGTFLIAPGDAELNVSILPVTTGYFYAIFADYPVLVRINGSSATQMTMKTNGRALVNAGSPKPPQCFRIATEVITELRLAPLPGAADTALVQVVITGNPLDAYT